jgi:hypothetical protein
MAKLSTLPIASNIVCSDQEVLGGIQGTRVLFGVLIRGTRGTQVGYSKDLSACSEESKRETIEFRSSWST